MGKIFVGKVLMSLYEQPTKAAANGELEPIKPGAWAAWAKAYADEQAAKAAAPVAPTKARVPDPFTPRLAPGPHHG